MSTSTVRTSSISASATYEGIASCTTSTTSGKEKKKINGNLEGNVLTIALDGRLDTNTAPDLEAYIKDRLNGVQSLVLDLEHVQYVSSAGLRVFLFVHKELMKVAGGLTLRKPNEYIMEVLEATGFVDILTIER